MSNQNDTQAFKPYISADRIMPEFTLTSILLGIILAVVFGAANAYLGLKVGMTISASIPAAVISMGVIRVILRKESILENNMVQTIGSAGESLAAGAIFTLPALYIWSTEWGLGAPSLLTITAIALCGGLLGVFFMVPLRKALIVKEHGVLPYPEGTACAEVLLAGEEGGSKAKLTFTGLGIGAIYKFFTDGFKLFPSEIETAIPGYQGAAIGADVLPALLGVGFIIGPKISAYMLGGAVIGWFGFIPLIANIGSMGEVIMYPASVPISELGYWGIWNYYIRYVGAGAVAFGGVYSLVKSLPLIVQTFKDAMKDYSGGIGSISSLRTDKDMSMKVVLIGSLTVILAMAMLPIIPVGIIGALMIAVLGFFFATVSSRIVGLVGSSSNPVSGMTIATLIITAIIFKTTGNDGQAGMIATLTVGAIICIIAAMAGDTSQDLKTGFLVGATPRKQQYGEIIGAVAAALAIGGVLTLLNNAWGFGSAELPAPQATLMRLVIEGVMGGNLPWSLVFTGIGMGIAIELLGLPVLPIAIGLYLPIHLSTPIMVGGLLRGVLDKRLTNKIYNEINIKDKIESGILYASGLIAGEGLIGILLAVFAVANINLNLGIDLGQIGALVFFGLLTFTLYKASIGKKNLLDKK
ncbi:MULTISPECIES: OPT family oligopeptide transporter [unclassified Fusibacter]|uniref:OPT family oligopeptide transporter n=1 Tax=unclassified Fusibacter TaxID=2624464 RepID=UPI0010123C7D|nr:MULTISPECIES: oligopeptide transporter, OPT family [unclassified Fusibacter]MCK8058574.1 oligopeptide transporter, OPT family [Fusibacter sp. A2]NPE22656.1 oligopeptide transporter, OPT family [Fusibacter sp. A1]RXV60219.1 oligopeptide transporter, OPT family [Fusibacter sp. A1]